MRVTVKDLAREAGVKTSTVSRAMNDSEGINPQTREHVLAVARRLGYRPNQMARGLVTGRSHSLGLIVSDIRNPFFAEFARGAQDKARGMGLDLVLCNSDLDPDLQMNYVESLLAKRVDGIIMTSVATLSLEQHEQLTACSVPLVLLGRSIPKHAFSTVCADCKVGGTLVAEHLLELGHEKIAHLTGPRHNPSFADREDGFTGVLRSASRPVEPLVLRGRNTFEGGQVLAKELFEKMPDVTAIFTGNDNMAFGVIRAIHESGRRIPDDISVVGYDNVALGSVLLPSLTTVDQPKYEMGFAAVEILLRLAGAEGKAFPEHRMFGVQLIRRQSCRAIQNS